MILLRSEYTGSHHISLNRLRKTAAAVLRLCGHTSSELSILLTTDAGIQALNAKYRQKDRPTNVLSFPMQEETNPPAGVMLGDVVISVDTAAAEAGERGRTLRRHINRLLIHGLVHLLGLDHERSEHEAAVMAARERELLQKLQEYERKKPMPILAINIDHVATLRQARCINEPDPVLAAGICELAGASGIVAHLREDRRHMQDRDLRLLRQTVKTKLNLEMGAAEEIINIALDLHPDMVTLVPENRQELTTEGGLDVAGQLDKLGLVIERLTNEQIPVSLFIDPEPKQIAAALEINATFVEIHTGRYCDAVNAGEREREFEMVAAAAEQAYSQGLRVNAGHGLNYQTTARVAALDTIEELSIGHAVMARAIMVGMDQAVREMLQQVRGIYS
ncbi:MAG: pyridoxine 5'-phosphate synthase [Deltaproteobacteria bacterium]|nr:pyridoxine 5'-phosphate synthase [Deltaproteobacteria bacterium]